MMPLDTLNRLAKWRAVLAGWQLGTRAATDPECQAVRDHREATIMLRAEVTTIIGLLVDKGVFTFDEFCARLEDAAAQLDADFATKFPGITATDHGLDMNLAVMQEHGTMKGWKP